MLKDKHTFKQRLPAVAQEVESNADEPEIVEQNALAEMYWAVKRALLTIKENPSDPESEPFFKTIALDNGQFQRIVRSENTEQETAFPAAFIHYTNVRYLVQQQRIGQGRATLRIRYILNVLNNGDEKNETDPFFIFQRINVAIQDAKSREPALNERCNLLYYDMPTTTNYLQAYWVDYEVWFKETAAFLYRDWVKRYLVMPPFTNHSDAMEHDKENHGDHTEPKYEEVTGIKPSVEEPDDPDTEEE